MSIKHEPADRPSASRTTPVSTPPQHRAVHLVQADQAGQRVDRLVAAWHKLSRAATRQLLDDGGVWLRQSEAERAPSWRATKGETVRPGVQVVVQLPSSRSPPSQVGPRPDQVAGEALRIVLLTDALVVVDKPAGQPCAPLGPEELGSVANGLLHRFPEMATVGHRPLEPGLCHRLDNGTSGLLLAARSAAAFDRLVSAIRADELHKTYLLICPVAELPEQGVIDWPLAPKRGDDRRVIACGTGRGRPRGRPRPARTEFRIIETDGASALVEARAPRALRHQIRAHFAALGAPLHGDVLYGSTVVPNLGRHALHAHGIAWRGDAQVAAFAASSPLPCELRELLAR